jgi:CheY-like chemotaxis protein
MPSWRRVAQPGPAIYERWALTMPVISIIDDDESVREGAMDLFESMGFITVAFLCASDFLGSDHLHDTSRLIADVQMSGMTGFELHNRLVGSGNIIPTILITAYPDDGDQARALQAGVLLQIGQDQTSPFYRRAAWCSFMAKTYSGRGQQASNWRGARSTLRLRMDLAAHNALVP